MVSVGERVSRNTMETHDTLPGLGELTAPVLHVTVEKRFACGCSTASQSFPKMCRSEDGAPSFLARTRVCGAAFSTSRRRTPSTCNGLKVSSEVRNLAWRQRTARAVDKSAFCAARRSSIFCCNRWTKLDPRILLISCFTTVSKQKGTRSAFASSVKGRRQRTLGDCGERSARQTCSTRVRSERRARTLALELLFRGGKARIQEGISTFPGCSAGHARALMLGLVLVGEGELADIVHGGAVRAAAARQIRKKRERKRASRSKSGSLSITVGVRAESPATPEQRSTTPESSPGVQTAPACASHELR